MPKNLEKLAELYQQASKDNFRHRFFSDSKGQSTLSTYQVGKALNKSQKTKDDEELSQIYLTLIAYLENETYSFYQTHGMKKAFIDQFVKTDKYEDEHFINQLINIIKRISNSPFEERSNAQNIFLESIKGILLTGMTATDNYTEKKAQEKLESILKM